jgi:hypothetical protein
MATKASTNKRGASFISLLSERVVRPAILLFLRV